jgi:hypothetical protein
MSTDHNHELIATLVAAYRDAADNGTDTETVLSDLIADLMHYADTLPADERVEGDGAGRIGETVADKAAFLYTDELDEEMCVCEIPFTGGCPACR